MISSNVLRKTAHVLHNGGVIAYPTEGVFGLGCLPDDVAAVGRILSIKQRDPAMGLVLIVSDLSQVADWVALPDKLPPLESSPDRPITWILPATDAAPYWIQGDHSGLAVRLTAHPVARSLCEAAGSALVSTSANMHGRRATRNRHVLRREFGALVDYVVPGDCGPATGASEIRDLTTGRVLRTA
jgi:L-threonylcarbamoyladenylate synthase